MTDDPFSPLADPYPPEPGRANQVSEPDSAGPDRTGSGRMEMTRKQAIRLMVMGTLAASQGPGCVMRRLACETVQDAPARCRHRFCRYYRG